MSGSEWWVVPIAGAAGYWLVSFLLQGRKPPPPPSAPPPPAPPEDRP